MGDLVHHILVFLDIIIMKCKLLKVSVTEKIQHIC